MHKNIDAEGIQKYDDVNYFSVQAKFVKKFSINVQNPCPQDHCFFEGIFYFFVRRGSNGIEDSKPCMFANNLDDKAMLMWSKQQYPNFQLQ